MFSFCSGSVNAFFPRIKACASNLQQCFFFLTKITASWIIDRFFLIMFQPSSIHGWTSAFLLAVHRLSGVLEQRLSHFLSRWLRTGWQSVISQRKIPWNTPPWLEIEPGPQRGQTVSYFTELSWLTKSLSPLNIGYMHVVWICSEIMVHDSACTIINLSPEVLMDICCGFTSYLLQRSSVYLIRLYSYVMSSILWCCYWPYCDLYMAVAGLVAAYLGFYDSRQE